VGHYPNTALFNPPHINFFFTSSPCQGSDLSSLKGRLILKKQGVCLMSRGKFSNGWQIRNFPEGLLNDFRGAAQCPVDRSWCVQRCCDGAATESLLRRRCADQLRRAHSARRVRFSDAAATELKLRAALLRQSCCDGAATESLLRRSCADQLRRAHSAHRVSTRRAE